MLQLISQFINETTHERTGSYLEESSLSVMWSVVVSIYCVGGVIGALLTGIVADKLGRKGGLLWNNVTVILAVVLEGFAKSAK